MPDPEATVRQARPGLLKPDCLRLFDRNLVLYLAALTVLIILFRNSLDQWYLYAAYHIAAILLLLLLLPRLDRRTNPVLRWIRNWYIIVILPFLYWDVSLYVHLITRREFDPLIVGVDRWLFGGLPNIMLLGHLSPALTEFMQISYSLYWVTIPLGGAIFYFTRNEDLYEQLLHYVTLTFFLSYFIFIFFPVAGPRFHLADRIHLPYEGLFLTDLLRSFMNEAGFRGGAFPSSHVAVAVVILIFMLKFRPAIGWLVFLPLAAALSLATVYGQYHYVTDVLAGLFMGMVIGVHGSSRAARVLTSTGIDQTAI